MQLVCWTLASMFNIAKINRPTPKEVSRFELAGWESPSWFEDTEHRANWASWVDSTWAEDLLTRLNDTWVTNAQTSLDGQGRTNCLVRLNAVQGDTLRGSLWQVLSGMFSTPGDFLEAKLGRGYCSEYPPKPTHTGQPSQLAQTC